MKGIQQHGIGYLVALAVTAIAVLLRWPLYPSLGDRVPFMTLFPAVAFIAWYCGRGPALLAIVVSSLAVAYFILEPRYSFVVGHTEYQAGLALFVLIGLGFIAMFEALRRASRQAAEQRERLRTTLASIGDAVIATDSEGCVTTMNAVAESLTGWKSAEAVGQPLDFVFRIVNEHTRKAVENPVEKVLKLGRIVGLANHTVLIAKDGTERPIDDSAAPIRCKEGEIVGCVLVFRDVTERRRQETALQRHAEELRDEREWLRVTLASIGDAVITTDTDGRITFLNAVAESVTGWMQSDAVGQPLDAVFNIVNEETRKGVENPAKRALKEGIIVGLANHTVLIRKDGAERPIDDSAAPIRDGQGRVIGCVLVFRDITQRRRLEKRIADQLAAARFLASIVESSGDAIISKSLDGVIQSWNGAAERLFGYKAEEAVGRNITFIIPPDRANEEEQIVSRIRAGERVDHFETVRVRSDGHPVHVSLTISPIRDETGEVVGVSKITRDVSDRKQAEERIYGLMAELQNTDRRKDEFLAMLAHELRGPLAPLSNMLEIMKRADGDGDLLQQARNTMERQLGHLVRLVDDLIDVSRITRDKIELRKERVELASIIQQSLEACQPLAEDAGHQVTVTLPPQPIYLHADPVRLGQVFNNLLSNACKYTEPGGKIWLTAERQGSDVAVKVKDTGLGILPDKLGSVFEMFTQIDRTLERSQGGLGIGLTLVKRLVEMHDGTVTAESEGAGKGSEFVVRLPILIEQPKHEGPKTVAVTTITPRRILVVDDNPDAVSTLAKLLSMGGNEVQIARDGMEAVEAAEKFQPDLVLLDIGLPKLNGYDACRRIREQPWGKTLVMVALTGWGQEDDRRKSKEAGFDHHMIKPVDYTVLMKLLAGVPATMKAESKGAS